MTRKRIVILPLAATLGALAGTAPVVDANAATSSNVAAPQPDRSNLGAPNAFIVVGEELLGFVISQQPDGTIIAQHRSHASHASHSSHSSHSSHFSSR